MKLPNGPLVLVGREKITDYLLNSSHPDHSGKAQFFASMGFQASDWEALARALRKLAQTADVAAYLKSVHGVKYILDGAIETPCGRTPTVRTVWIVDRGRNCPRLVTAYPAEP